MPRQQRAIGGKGKKGSFGNAALFRKGAGHKLGHISSVACLKPRAQACRKPVQIDFAKLCKAPVSLAVGDLQGKLGGTNGNREYNHPRRRRQAKRRWQ